MYKHTLCNLIKNTKLCLFWNLIRNIFECFISNLLLKALIFIVILHDSRKSAERVIQNVRKVSEYLNMNLLTEIQSILLKKEI